MAHWTIEWAFGKLEVHSMGAMIAPIFFKIHGKESTEFVQPMWIAKWAGKLEQPDKHAKLDSNLRGEWPCLPFGSARKVHGLTPAWEKVKCEVADAPPHGECSNTEWTLVKQTKEELVLEVRYPESSAIERMVRVVRPDPNGPAVDFELKEPYSSELRPPPFEFGHTFPGMLEPTTIIAPDTSFSTLSQLQRLDGTALDVSRLPLPEHTENVIELCNCEEGRFQLLNHNRKYRVQLDWNTAHLSNLQLWISNKGRPFYPWHGNLALGVEPLCAAFDLGTGVSAAPNPLAARNVRTAVEFEAGREWSTSYRISAAPL